jgi:hypothetical protein
MRGGDKAPLPRRTEAGTRLMPDSHNAVCESRSSRALPLDGFSRRTGRTSKKRSGRTRRRLNLSPRGRTHLERSLASICRLSAESNQDEIDQRNQGGADTGGHQGIVGADVGVRIERCLVRFSGHFGGLGRAGRSFCELGHILPIFFAASSSERVDVIRVGKDKAGGQLGQDRTGTGDASAGRAMAIGTRPEIVAVDACRHHGSHFPSRISRLAGQSVRANSVTGAAGASGVSLCLRRVAFQPAKLATIRLPFAAAAACRARSRAAWLLR